MKYHFLFLFTTFIIVSCSKEKSNLVEFNDSNIRRIEINSINELVDRTVLIPIENTPNCIISSVKKIEFCDNKIFVLNGNIEVLILNLDGKVVAKVNKKGKGPGEFLALNSMVVNSFKKQICLLDAMLNKIHTFDFKGKFISSIKVKFNISSAISCEFLNADEMLFVNGVTSFTKNSSQIFNTKSKKLEVLTITKHEFNGVNIYANPVLTKSNQFILFPLSDTIYQYKNGHVTAALNTNLNKGNTNSAIKIEEGDFEKSFRNYRKNGNYIISEIFELDNYLLIRTNALKNICSSRAVFLWNINEKHGIRFNESDNCSLSKVNLPLWGYTPKAVNNNELVYILTPNDINDIAELYKKDNISPSIEICNMFQNIKIDSNPIICLQHWKSDVLN